MFCYFNLKLLHEQRVTFWRLSFCNIRYLVAPSRAGLIFIPVPASPASTAGGGDSPSYSGFFHCLAVFDDQSSSCFNPNSCVLQNVWNSSPRVFYPMVVWFIPCNFYSNLRDYLFANKLTLKSTLCSVIFDTRLNSPSTQQD